ncbi:MAG: hypothetical protein L6R41_003221 [Letrouitia leprolyta]|nr:MAG: hypothetical protein L6R41_003221 [Letrouitia leprolyta]
MSNEKLQQSVPSDHLQLSASNPNDYTLQNKTTLLPPSQEKNVDIKNSPTRKVPVKPMPSGPSLAPDGGLQAWLQVLGAFMLWFNSWGILNAFGVFQTYYESGELFTKSSFDISWIGSSQSFMLLATGLFAGPLYDRGYLRTLLFAGSFGVVFGHMMLSLCDEYWQVVLAQGICVGLGAGCLFIPSVSVLPTYFSSKIGLAIGLGSSGSSIGGIIYPIVLYRLIDRIGFAWAVRVMAFMALGTLLIPLLVMRIRVRPPKARDIIDVSAFTDAPYMILVMATLIGFAGLSIVLFYISYYALEQRILDTRMSFYIIAIFNAASTFGRTAPNALSDRVGPFNLIAPSAVACGILMFCMIAVSSETAIIILAILIGFFSGVFIAMPPVCFVALVKDKSRIGTRIGMGFAISGFV